MGAVRSTKTSLLCVLALAFVAAACGERPVAKKGDPTAADVLAGAAESLDHYESPEGKFGIDFPAVWKGHYIGVPHTDTAFGSRAMVEFRFKPDTAWKVQPQTLLGVRIFTPDSWAKANARSGAVIGIKLAERGNDVYVVSLATGNPYKPGTPAAELFDKMMLAVFNTAPRLTPR
jgi:hypothetical protein